MVFIGCLGCVSAGDCCSDSAFALHGPSVGSRRQKRRYHALKISTLTLRIHFWFSYSGMFVLFSIFVFADLFRGSDYSLNRLFVIRPAVAEHKPLASAPILKQISIPQLLRMLSIWFSFLVCLVSDVRL
jgi:hypothetical protein